MEGHHEEIGEHTLVVVFGNRMHADTLLATYFVIAILILLILIVRRRITLIPGPVQMVVEAIIGLWDKIAQENMGPKGREYMPLIFSLFVFIFVSNQVGMLPSGGWLISPTSDLNTNLAMALLVIFIVQIVTIREKGIKGWVKHYCSPMFLFLPINIIEELAKPMTLSCRLFGNIIAGEIVIIILGFLAPYVFPAVWILFSLFVGLLQAFIFTVLTISYLAGAVGEGH